MAADLVKILGFSCYVIGRKKKFAKRKRTRSQNWCAASKRKKAEISIFAHFMLTCQHLIDLVKWKGATHNMFWLNDKFIINAYF